MDKEESQEHEVFIQGSWIPETPYNPILPKPVPIYADGERNQQQENWLRSEGLSFCSPSESQGGRVVACSENEDCVGTNSVWGGNFPLAWDNIGKCLGPPVNVADKLNKIPFLDLLALADAALVTSCGKETAAANGSLISALNTRFDEQIEPSCSTVWTNGNYTPELPEYVISDPHQRAYDLNFATGTNSDAVSTKTVPQFAPVTPGKSKIVDSADSATGLSIGQKQDHDGTIPSLDDSLQQDKELSKPDTVSSAIRDVICTANTENHNPDKGHGLTQDLIETPQPKQKRKKHRPKVITEGKPRTRQPVTPKPAGSKENPQVKRKYVRRNGVKKPSTTLPSEVEVESANQKVIESTRNSCRRALIFDTESQPRDEGSSCASFGLDSESRAHDFRTTKAQQSSNTQLDKEIEEMVQDSRVGCTYDLNCSTNLVLKDYMSISERQDPTAEILTEHSSQETKPQSNSQKEKDIEKKSQASDHTEQENMAQSHKSLNDSVCCTTPIPTEKKRARGSKRKLSSAIKQADNSSTNLTGVHYNALQAYQMSLVHFPHIYKRRRTEKSQASTASSASSSVAAAESIVSQRTTCPQDDPRENVYVRKASDFISEALAKPGKVATKLGEAGKHLQEKLHAFQCILDISQTERSTRKRSRGRTRIRDLASLARIAEYNGQPSYSTKQPPADNEIQGVKNSHKPHTWLEVEEMCAKLARKRRTKKKSPMKSVSSDANGVQEQCKLVLYNHHQSIPKTLGTNSEVIRRQICSIDTVVEQLKFLDINRESSNFASENQNALVAYDNQNQEHNALFIYQRDGTIVPFEGLFNSLRKRRPRPKVDLDEETDRVWRLLLGNINSQGIDGTDEEKTKWWEEERRVFRGRADSFIARMHLVQGDRRFSPWKGSVLDSVIGVFLTQNVSDHLSSSAFMSLASRFPVKLRTDHKACSREDASLVIDEPDECMLIPEDTLKWNKQIPQQPICRDSFAIADTEQTEEKEVVNSSESFGSNAEAAAPIKESEHELLNSSGSNQEMFGKSMTRSTTEMIGIEQAYCSEQRATHDTLSSQISVISSQDSMDSSISQATESMGPCLESSSEADRPNHSKEKSLDSSTSSVMLVKIAGSTTLRALGSIAKPNFSSADQSKDACNQSVGMENGKQNGSDGQASGRKIFLGESKNHTGNVELCLMPTSAVSKVECCERYKEVTHSCDVSENKYEYGMSKQSSLTKEFTAQDTIRNVLASSVHEEPTCTNELSDNTRAEQNMIFQSQSRLIKDLQDVESQAGGKDNKMHQHMPNLSGESPDVIEKTIESDPRENDQSLSKEFDKMKAAKLELNRKRPGKEKKEEIDWDNMRKQAESDGRKRERTENTMDSLDWEAVRCADVGEIANAIRERGMNNKLAERIKNFLNRLMKDHGSIDLEWLRNVPPDQAKEYLLSVRGLGLKSVECVRLLTLHHLAFPVDTNVGRIAVRLGWVPLQPLPESLQLHLLELYPVLESIQKYLWPRLCKLDQRTLYELHYQMITFGKVFCTKNKPNCNACPLRGECRHFASAFASARLALPEPEEKRIVGATESTTPDQDPTLIINQQPLLLPHPIEQSQVSRPSESGDQCNAIYGASSSVPIIEEPVTPDVECTQVPEVDIEDALYEDPDEIPTIKLNIQEFTLNLQNYMQQNMELQDGDMSKALVALTPEAASLPTPKLKNVSRLRTEHQVYELPDSHPLLEQLKLDRREPDDPCLYLLAIWTPGETANSIELPERRCSYQAHGNLCEEKECFSCNSVREANSQLVRGTLLIPCRTAMRGSFPLNGTYFQVNEVFADHDSSLDPIDVPRAWIWNLPRRTVYFGTSIPTIFKGLSTEGIQHCFWRGYVCVRGFDQKTRAPRPLMARLHFPASKLMRTKGKADDPTVIDSRIQTPNT